MVLFEFGHVSIIEHTTETDGWVKLEDEDRHYNGLYNINREEKIPAEYDITKVFDDFIIVAKRDENTYHYQMLGTKGETYLLVIMAA